MDVNLLVPRVHDHVTGFLTPDVEAAARSNGKKAPRSPATPDALKAKQAETRDNAVV